MRPRFLILLVFLGVLTAFSNPPMLAGTRPRVLIIDLPRLTLQEIDTGYPNLLKLVETGAVGLMATPLAEPLSLDQIYLAINSGLQLKTAEENYLVFDVGEEYKGIPAGRLYQSLTGEKAPLSGAVHLSLAKIVQINSQNLAVAENIGMLGRILHQNKIKTGAIGNADADLISRCGSLLLMDQKGQLDYGAIGPESTSLDPRFPFGLRTDTGQILNAWRNLSDRAQVIVVTLGDLERLERFNTYLNDYQWNRYRRQVLAEYDRLLGDILGEIDARNTLTMVFTALPPARNYGKNGRLAPVIIKGPGFRSGLIASASTRRPGFLTCYDLPVTILSFLHIPKNQFFSGHILTGTGGDWRQIAAEEPGLVKNYDLRWPLLTVYGYLLIGLVLAAFLGAVFWPRRYNYFQGLAYGYLFLLTIPAIFLIEAAINPLDWVSIIGLTLGLGALVFGAALILAHRDQLRVLAVISAFTVGLILFEGAFNGFLELRSFLGYSVIAGARFYGVGNEYAGFLLGAYIVAVSSFLPCLRRYRIQLLWLITGLIAVFLAHPNLGANITGGIIALIGLGVTNYLWVERPIRAKEVLGLAGALVVLLILVGLWDICLNRSNMSHFGQFLTLLKGADFPMIWGLLNRKLALNFRLIAYTPWTKVLIAILVVIPFIYSRPPGKVADLIQKYPNRLRGFFGLTLTAIAALVLEDSGIVTVTTMFIFGMPMLLLVLLKEWVVKGVIGNGGSPDHSIESRFEN